MTKQDIIKAIEDKRGSISYGSWTIGVTDDPETRKQQHENDGKNVSAWKHWKTDSEQIGRDVEAYFLEKGMKGGGGGGGKAGYVYIF
jgi:hypothetical protein